jgi:hypothetical protein
MPLPLQLAVLGAAALCIIGIVLAIYAFAIPAAIRRDSTLQRAYFFIGTGFSIAAISLIVFQLSRPVATVEGVIDLAQVQSEGPRARTYIRVQSLRSAIVLNASGTNEYFRPGERIRAKYRVDSGFVLKATLLSPEGREVATFHGRDAIPPYFGLFAGGFFLWMGVRARRRELVTAG